MTARNFLLVALGGAAGSCARYAVSLLMLAWAGNALPWGTLAVNVVGSGVGGFLLARLARDPVDHPWRLLLVAGTMGGFTTFSALSAETVALAQSHRPGAAALNLVLNVVLGLAAAFGAFALFRP